MRAELKENKALSRFSFSVPSTFLTVHYWADPLDAEEIDERIAKIRADLLSV